MAYRSKLLQDIEAGEAVGFFTDPPCETFIGHRYRDAEGAGRYGRTRKRKAGKLTLVEDSDMSEIRTEKIMMERAADLALTCSSLPVPFCYYLPCSRMT